jgi:hypothetical protein
MGMVLVWGFALAYVTSSLAIDWNPSMVDIFIAGLVIPIIGIVASADKSAFVSFMGFTLVAASLGAMLGLVPVAFGAVAQPGMVAQVAVLTGMAAGIMCVSGLLSPKLFQSTNGALLTAFVAWLVAAVVSLFVPALAEFTVIHYIAAGLFAIYIGFDMWRASNIPATSSNAVDACAALYLGVVSTVLQALRAKK